MQRDESACLWDYACNSPTVAPAGSLSGFAASVDLGLLARGSSLGGRIEEFRDRSVLISTEDQLTAALALIELDGIVRRLVLCPPGLSSEHLAGVIAAASVDGVVSDRPAPDAGAETVECFVRCSTDITGSAPDRRPDHRTEWVLLTSGTTGTPKLVAHTLLSLAGAIDSRRTPEHPIIWSTFYDTRRYGGLQILIRAVLGGNRLVLSDAREPVEQFLDRAGACGVTNISGTPSHWRRALMSPAAGLIAPRYVRLSGEIADQAILDRLQNRYPHASIAHAFASTEAGVAFEVGDGFSGFPASLIGSDNGKVAMKVEDGSLRIRSARNASRYVGGEQLSAEDGFVDTGDLVELRGDRYYFVGRKGGVINVGGLKVHPEEVEAVLNRHPAVQMSRVRARPNPIIGAVVIADIVVRSPSAAHDPLLGIEGLRDEILAHCRRELVPYKVPASLRFVPSLDLNVSGKLVRASG